MTQMLFVVAPFSYGDMQGASPIYPSVGLATIMACLEKAGYTVKILDMLATGYDEKGFIEALKDPELKVMGVSAIGATILKSFELAKRAKELRPDVKIIAGGPHLSILPEHTMRQGSIDYGIIGEGEITAVELMDYVIKKKGTLATIKGLCYMDHGKLIMNEKRPWIANLDDLPFPAYHLLPMDKYRAYAVYDNGRRTLSMVTSRGCPFLCTFCCSSKVFGGRWRAMSAKKALEHIQRLHDEFGVRHIYFEDDEFTVRHDRVIELCQGMIDKKWDITWDCLTRVSHINDEILAIMAKAGCKSILYGVETGYEEGLKQIKKGITLDQVTKAVKLTQKYGIRVKATFIIGFPWETRENVMQTIDFAAKLGADYPSIQVLCPFPTTEIYEQIRDEDLFIPEFTVDMYTAILAPRSLVRTKHLTSEEIVQLMGYGYRRLYMQPKYLFRKLTEMNNFSDLKRHIAAGWSVLKLSVKSSLFKSPENKPEMTPSIVVVKEPVKMEEKRIPLSMIRG